MEQLMFIIGFEQEIKISKLKELAKNYFEGNELLMIWRDPYSEPRAVLMFQEPLDIESSRKSHYKALKDENYFVCVEKPTSCIFIRTYKASKYGLIDKLILLFMKTLHTSVIDKVQLEDSCFKIEFKDGWDAVLKACNRNWKINETELTVLPFFESFQESFDDQWPRLELEINKLNETLFSHDDLETPVNYTEMVEAVSGEHDTSSVDNTLIIFTNELMPEIIDKLNIKDALKSHKYEFMIHNDEKVEISGEISGAKNKLRSIQQVIYEEDQQVTNLLKSTNAVINTEILKTNKYFIVFSEDSGKFTMDVTGENCEKIPFHHFVSSIMFSKTFDGKEGDLPQQSVPSQVKVQPSYQFEHCFTFGILKALKFDHLLKRKYPGIIVDFDVTEETKVFISRPVMEIKELFSIIKQEEEKINLNKEETLFLSQKIIMDEIEKQNHIIEFCESSKILQVRGPQPTARFSDYVNSLIITKKINCGEIDPKAFTTYRDSFNKEHSFGQITFLKGKVIFLCLSFNLSAIEIFVQLIKDSVEPLKIKSLTDDYTQSKDITVQPEKTDNFTNATYTYEKMDTSSNEKNREYILETWQYEYCTMFIHELKKGKDVTDIKLLPNKLIVSFKPFTSDYSITSFQKYLDSIQHQETILEYQGLSQFAKLNEGREIISEISKSTQCCILVPDKLLKETEAIETENYDYKTILLFTADCDRFKIHLVQGHIEDIKTQMSVEILPAQNGEINLQGYFSQYNLLLPKWSLREDDPEFLDRLRSSLKTYVEIIFKQAVHLGYSNIALFLENIHDELCSFPLDLVAKTIYEQLFEGLDSDVGAASARQELDVYICDYDHESVFNAFKYYIKKFGCEFGPPSQEKWDQISLKDTSKYVEYSSNMVEIKSTSPLRALENILFCYPILPTLEPFTSPIVNQADVSYDYLKREIQNFEDCNPDGIPEDGYFPLSYWPYKDVIIYCCPDWGPKADKAIYRSLKVCLYVATNKSAVYIVPPGMERTSKYPAKYLAQAMFKALDKLYNKISKRLKIFFVVDKKEYEKAFNDELKKRTPLTAKSYMQRFSSSFQSIFSKYLLFDKKTELKGQMPLMEQTPVVFVSLSTSKISNGCHTFQAKLNELMSSNKFKIELIGDEINSFEAVISNEYLHPVIWNIIGTEKRDKLQVVKLMVRGLNMNWVMEFEKQIKSHSRKTSYVGSSVDLSSRPDQKKKLNQEPNKDKKSESQSFTDMKSKPKDDYPSLEPNEACKNYQKKEKEKTKKKVNKKPKNVNNPPTKAEFTWKYENEKIHSFEDFEKPIVDKLEKYFAVDIAPQKVLVDKIFHQYQSVDFFKMKIIEKKEDAPTTIIRCEILKEDNNILCPGNWQVPKKEEYLLKKVDDTLPELTEPLEDLKNALKLMHNFEIISIEQVQNNTLYRRFKTKCNLLPAAKTKFLWYRVQEENFLKVCRVGFHKSFSFPKDFSDVGDGIAFSSDVKSYFQTADSQCESDTYFIYSEVFTGNESQATGKKLIRSPPVDKKTGQIFHSITKDKICMVFSDAQAYPLFLIKLRNKNRKETNL